jgi:hypothetical protein
VNVTYERQFLIATLLPPPYSIIAPGPRVGGGEGSEARIVDESSTKNEWEMSLVIQSSEATINFSERVSHARRRGGGMRPDHVGSGLGTPRRKVRARVYTLVSSSTGGGGGGSGSDHGNGLWSELASLHRQQGRPRLGHD